MTDCDYSVTRIDKENDDDLIGLKDAAKYLGMSVNKFRSMTDKNLIPYVRYGTAKKKYTYKDLDKYLKREGQKAF